MPRNERWFVGSFEHGPPYTARWSWKSWDDGGIGWVDWEIWEIIAQPYPPDGTQFYEGKDSVGKVDNLQTDPRNAEVYCNGFLKFDGCHEYTLSPHQCDPQDTARDFAFILRVLATAATLMAATWQGEELPAEPLELTNAP